MGVGRVTRRAKEVFISKSVRPYRVSASTVVTLHCVFENDGLSEPIFTIFATLVQLRAGPCFAALHMSASGTSHQFAAMRHFGRFRSKAED
jgi:hypothetical protein